MGKGITGIKSITGTTGFTGSNKARDTRGIHEARGTFKVSSIFAAVFEKSVLDPLLAVLDKNQVKFWGTEGTMKYVKVKGYSGKSVVTGFDFDGRVKSLDRLIFARILADRTNKKHLDALRNDLYSSSEAKRSREVSLKSSSRQGRTISTADFEPFDLVVVDLYEPDKNNFPESMDIGGQALIRAAIKNFQNVALAFDEESVRELVAELRKNAGSTILSFRKVQAKSALKFIAERSKLESDLFSKL